MKNLNLSAIADKTIIDMGMFISCGECSRQDFDEDMAPHIYCSGNGHILTRNGECNAPVTCPKRAKRYSFRKGTC